MSAYTIYLDKEETFECTVSIKNASIKDSSARLIIESDDINLVFFGTVSKDTISVPIKSLKKYFTESDKATIKLEVIVENNLVIPWQSELLFDSYNKVEIKEIKNIKTKPLIEIKLKDDRKQQRLETKTKEIEQTVVTESKKSSKSLKQKLLESINEEVKKIQVDGKLNKEEKKQLIKKLLSNEL
jgi:hypothetical protein